MRALLAGLGSWGMQWYEKLTLRDDIFLAGAVDLNTRLWKTGNADCRFYADAREAMDALKPDFVLNATPPNVHRLINDLAFDRGIFQPIKYGIEHENKYRYYSPTQITTVKMIRVLTEIGVPLQVISELAEGRTPEMLMKLLSKQKGIIADELRFLHEAHSVISTFLELLTEGISAIETEIFVSELPEKKIIIGEKNDFCFSVDFYREYMRFCNTPREPRLNLSYPVGGYFESMDVFLNEPSQPTHFFSIDPKGHEKKAAGLYLIGYTRGYYGQTNDLPKRMAAFAKKNGLIFNGPVYNIYLFDEMSITDTEQYLLQVSASVKETRRVASRRPVRR